LFKIEKKLLWFEKVKFGVVDPDPDPAFQANTDPGPDPRFK
jgi:hypothetical protein